MLMARPRRCRWVGQRPRSCFFAPEIKDNELEEVTLHVEEFEAMRLKYHVKKNATIKNEGGEEREKTSLLTQQEAATEMGVSQSTFSRILEQAHVKITEALLNGRAIRIEGGRYGVKEVTRSFGCQDCLGEWPAPTDFDITAKVAPPCPTCSSIRTFMITRKFMR